ncbi:MAG: ATP-binding protein [Paludibacteraceae bacterium]|nr:ATP-binding protein [Paludibacteraceae bacterium]HPH63491.1 ATP-binding protein [Paludibacteraceae bacterium]
MEVKAKDIIDSVDLSKSESFLPLYECIVNSIVSLIKSKQKNSQINIFIERETSSKYDIDFFDKTPQPIKSITLYDNGEGFTEENFNSFNAPFSKVNKKYGCKGVGRFTMLAMFKQIKICSIFKQGNKGSVEI